MASLKHTPKAPAVAPKSIVNDGSFAAQAGAASALPSTPAPPPVAPKADTASAQPQPAFIQQLSGLTAAQLKAVTIAVRDELRNRRSNQAASRPQRGAQVVITGAGKHQGKRATVVVSTGSRTYVDVEGVKEPVAVKHDELRPLTADEAAK